MSGQPMQPTTLKGRVAVITGASSGIGEASARALAAEGVDIVLAARSETKIQTLAEELGESAEAVPTDVGDPEQVRHLFEVVQDKFGGLDLLLNNAGVGYYAPFADSDPTEWRRTMDANVYGVLACTQAAIPLMRGREGPMICTVSSVAGRGGIEGWSVYCASKFAVVGFHDALRKELGPEGIRVSLIEPGAVHTNWGFNIDPDTMRERRERIQALTADDVAQAVVYAFAQPAHLNPQELLVMPTRQTYP